MAKKEIQKKNNQRSTAPAEEKAVKKKAPTHKRTGNRTQAKKHHGGGKAGSASEQAIKDRIKNLSSFSFDDIVVEFEKRRVYKNGQEVPLKPKEFELLETFINNRNLALSREKLISLVWDYAFDGDNRTVDVHVQKLRQKLGLTERLQTVYKLGYRLEI